MRVFDWRLHVSSIALGAALTLFNPSADSFPWRWFWFALVAFNLGRLDQWLQRPAPSLPEKQSGGSNG